MKNILITGAGGVLAQKLIKKLKDDDFNIIVTSRNIENIDKLSNVKYINNADIIKTDILKDVDLIINCAFPRKQEPSILAEAVQFFNWLIICAVKMNVKNFINISSQSVYPPYRQYPVSEFDEIKPADNYGLTKYACEIIGCTTTKNTNTKFTNLRLASLIGVEYPQRVINKIIQNALNTKKISIDNDKNVFGYLDIDDAVDGIVAFIKNSNPENWAGVYNLGQTYPEQKNFAFIANIIFKLFKKENIEIDLNIKEAQKAEKCCLMNSNEFYKISKWKPQIPLQKSIENIFRSINNEFNRKN